METWRLLTTWDEDPAFNMGFDEALLERDGPPTLRLYSWKPDALSLGYFQRVDDVPAAERAPVVVRRITGGGAIHHADELTFSITVPGSHRVYAGPVAESYVRVHAAVADALGRAGVEARLRERAALRSDRAGTGMCFHASTPLDLVWDGRKGVGSAQRRRGARILHHGSIKLGASPLEEGVAHLAGNGRDELAEHVTAALGEHFGLRFQDSTPTAEERREAIERGERYVDPAFVARR